MLQVLTSLCNYFLYGIGKMEVRCIKNSFPDVPLSSTQCHLHDTENMSLHTFYDFHIVIGFILSQSLNWNVQENASK